MLLNIQFANAQISLAKGGDHLYSAESRSLSYSSKFIWVITQHMDDIQFGEPVRIRLKPGVFVNVSGMMPSTAETSGKSSAKERVKR